MGYETGERAQVDNSACASELCRDRSTSASKLETRREKTNLGDPGLGWSPTSSTTRFTSPQSCLRFSCHVATVLSLPTNSVAASSICCVKPDRLLAASLLGGDALSRPAAPTPGNEMLVASDAMGDENGMPDSRGRCSSEMRRKDKTPPEASNTSTSLKLCWRWEECDEGRSERPDDVLGEDAICGGKRLVGKVISLPLTNVNESSERKPSAPVARVERNRTMGVNSTESGCWTTQSVSTSKEKVSQDAHGFVDVPYLGIHVAPEIGLSPVRIDRKDVYRALASPNSSPSSVLRDFHVLNDGGRTTTTKIIHVPRCVLLRTRWRWCPIRDGNRPKSSASVLSFFPISTTHVTPAFDPATHPSQYMRTSSKLKNTHDLSVLGPNEKRIPVVHKRKMADRLMLGGDKLGDDLGKRRSTRVHERSQIEHFDVRARGRRILGEQCIAPDFDVA